MVSGEGRWTTAWNLGAGDVLAGGARVAEVQRDPVARTVRLTLLVPVAQVFGEDELVELHRRADEPERARRWFTGRAQDGAAAAPPTG